MSPATTYYPRTLEAAWLDASRQFPVVLLTGPRQVGKTTLLQHCREADRTYVTLDDPAVRALARNDPALFLQRFEPPVLIDEIQYAPQLLPLIKMAVDDRRQSGMFWLTGSQHFQMMKGVSESLAGRVAVVHLLGFSQRERHRGALAVAPFLPTDERLADRRGSPTARTLKQLYEDIWLGSFPALAAGAVTDRDLFFSSYLQTYLQRDLRDLAQVADEAAFLRFLRACAARTGQLLNLTDLARDADISPNTAKSWLSILQTTSQVLLLQPYHSNLTKRLVKSPKLYFLDTGLCAYLTEWSSPATLEAGAMTGQVLETFVLSEILKSWWHRGQTPQMYYYRDRDKREIDLLLFRDGTIHPIEIKKSAAPRRDWAAPFSALDRLGRNVGPGGVICLARQMLPIAETVSAIPISLL